MINDIVEHFNNEDPLPPAPPAPVTPHTNQSFPKASSTKFASWRERKLQREKAGQIFTPPGSSTRNKKQQQGEEKDTLADSSIAKALRKAQQRHGGNAKKFTESERIHIENLETLARMSPEEIERERNELLAMMDEHVLRGLLKRATGRGAGENELDDDEVARVLGQNPMGEMDYEEEEEELVTTVDNKDEEADLQATEKMRKTMEGFSIANVGVDGLTDDERYPSFEELQQIQKEMDDAEAAAASNVHFPQPREHVAAELDPTDPQFNEKLHAKYFPALPTEPEKMEWMQPVDEAKEEEELQQAETLGLLPRELRFDFKGHLVSPRQGREISVRAGLHHHGDAPSLAGYTLPELAHLARSSAASQRALAIQTLGRVLFRLGRGRDYGQQIGAGLWGLVDETRVLESLAEAADEKKTRSVSVRAYAVEALWLWRQGGGARPAV